VELFFSRVDLGEGGERASHRFYSVAGTFFSRDKLNQKKNRIRARRDIDNRNDSRTITAELRNATVEFTEKSDRCERAWAYAARGKGRVVPIAFRIARLFRRYLSKEFIGLANAGPKHRLAGTCSHVLRDSSGRGISLLDSIAGCVY
jgi:hypothetical protein